MGALDHVRCCQRPSELHRQSGPGRLGISPGALFNRAGDTWCVLLKAPGKVSKKPLGGVCIIELPGLAAAGMQFPGQAIDDVPARKRWIADACPEGPPDRCTQRLGAGEHEQAASRRVQASLNEVACQRLHRGHVLGGSLHHTERMLDFARACPARWRQARRKLEDPSIDRSSMDVWLQTQRRAFAIETGQIEGLYLLRRGVTETLIAESFGAVRGAHSATEISDNTPKGLLEDQEAALEMMFAHVREERPLVGSAIKEWHLLLTRHQETAAGIDPFGNRTEIPLRKGQYKIRSDNPRRRDGFIHEYCPPEQVQVEMDRFLAFHESHAGLDLAPELEAAWLHHEFVRSIPSRMAMAGSPGC